MRPNGLNPSLQSLDRRAWLLRAASGFGAAALAALYAKDALFANEPRQASLQAASSGMAYGANLQALHHPARAKAVIFLYMDGGPSQVDTFDPKPRLEAEHGQPIKMKVPATQFANVGTVLKSPWAFQPRGESGLPVSDLLPHMAKCADDLCVLRSMTSKFSEHTNANYFFHTGHGLAGRPCTGAWTTYGLGSVCDNLPGFVVLNGGLVPPGGLDNFGAGFLPAAYQGSVFKSGSLPVANIVPAEAEARLQQNKLALMQELDKSVLARLGTADALNAAIHNYELAFQMQAAVPELMDLSGESQQTHALYGLNSDFEPTRIYGSMCLLARRMVERGVRFIEVTCPSVGTDRWDQHSDLAGGHAKNALAVDQPCAALIQDLKQRGMLDDTLILWGGEFGRTPMAQGSDGRDHNPFGYSVVLAGGGVKGGMSLGATDEYGYYAVERTLEMHDLHATMLHLLGVNHERLTYRFGGRDMRLTDISGHVIEEILR